MADMQYLMSRKRELDTLMQMKTSTEKLNKFLVSISSRMDHMNQGMEGTLQARAFWPFSDASMARQRG